MSDDLSKLLDPKAMAERLSMPVSSIYRMVRDTDIPRYRFGRLIRFEPNEVLEWIRTHTQEGDHGAAGAVDEGSHQAGSSGQ